MQFRSFGRLRVMRRIEGRGKERRMCSCVGGGEVRLFGVDIFVGLEFKWVSEWKMRTGQQVRERV